MNERNNNNNNNNNSNHHHDHHHHQQQHAIVVVAKCPIPGKSKTRLISLLGTEGSAKFAKAMLSDVIVTLTECESLQAIPKILFFAPGDANGRSIMMDLLTELQIRYYEVMDDAVDPKDVVPTTTTTTTTDDDDSDNDGPPSKTTIATTADDADGCWILLPIVTATNRGDSLTATDLGDILTGILNRTRAWIVQTQQQQQQQQHGKVVFLGMDSPELPLEEIASCLQDPKQRQGDDDNHDRPQEEKEKQTTTTWTSSDAVLCPAKDGGYGMLCVPPQAPACHIFRGIRWSDPLTALGQLKALTDCRIPVRLGRLMHDIDEPDDVQELCQRLLVGRVQEGGVASSSGRKEADGDVLLKSSTSSTGEEKVQTGQCRYTLRALQELGLASKQ